MIPLCECGEVENRYRPLLYWAWYDKIEPREVRWQITQMHRAGFGGYVMAAFGGLEIPYMGEEWHECVDAMIEQGSGLDMTTIVDDEYGWPSGTGAGEVNKKGEEYRLKYIACEKTKVKELVVSPCTIGIYLIDGNTSCRIAGIESIDSGIDTVLHIFFRTDRHYVDNLDPKVVKEFIIVSYERYYREYNSGFAGSHGMKIAGIFTDEPQIARGRIPWSSVLTDEFRKRCGYDVVDVLPALFCNTEGCEKVRYDFWNTVNSLFVDSYSRQIGEWCERHNIAFMGHTLDEDNLLLQLKGSAGTMPFYEHMHIPGIDWLHRRPVCNVTVKQAASVGQQLGKERILSEMFACAGWNISMEEIKWLTDWQYLLGINLMMQSHGKYSMKGSRKRGYPPSIFYQQPWWNEYRPVNDYFAGLSRLMVQTEPVIDILVIHPMKSAWILYCDADYRRIENLDSDFKKVTENLLQLNYDFHYGDEQLMAGYGSVTGNKLAIGRFLYGIVIIPPAVTLDEHTVNVLLEFAYNGGKIISIRDFPCLIEGKYSEKLEQLRALSVSIDLDGRILGKVLNGWFSRHIHITDANRTENKYVFCCTRKTDECYYYFVLNTSREEALVIDIGLAHTGEVASVNLLENKEVNNISLSGIRLQPMQSLLLKQRIDSADSKEGKEPCNKTYELHGDIANCSENNESHFDIPKTILLNGDWEIEDATENSITLDYCSYAIDDGPWMGEIPVIKLQEKLLAIGKPVNISLKFEFFAICDLPGDTFLVLEEPEKYDICINRHKIDNTGSGWWIDKSFIKIDIGNCLKTGGNEIVLKRYFYCSDAVYGLYNSTDVHEAELNRIMPQTEIESVYIVGNFSVDMDGCCSYGKRETVCTDGRFILSSPRKRVGIGDLVVDGYPFFAGRIKLSRIFNMDALNVNERVYITFDRLESIITKVYLNDIPVKTLFWQPYTVDATGFVKEGSNTIAVELINSCRNLLGPHHHIYGEVYGVGPASFSGSKGWTDEECRMENAEVPADIWTDQYCFVRFGAEVKISFSH